MVFSLEEKRQSLAKSLPNIFGKMFYGPRESLLNIVALIPTSAFGVNTSVNMSRVVVAASCSGALVPRRQPGISIKFQIPVKFGTKASGRKLRGKIHFPFQ